MSNFDIISPIPSIEEIGIPIIAPVHDGPADIIPGLLPRQGQLVIAGETNVGKSLLALEICSALTTEIPLWGELVPTVKAKKILYILGEHYREVIQRLWQVTELPMSENVWLVGPEQLAYDKWLVNNGKPNPVAVAKMSKWADGADLIVFDPLAAFITGQEGSENDNIQMRLVMDTMSLVAQNTGASSLILAHQGKPVVDYKTGTEMSRKKYAIRGASGVEDAATNIFYFGMAEGQSEASKGSKIYKLLKRKYKGDAPDEYRLMRNQDNLTHTLFGNRPFVEIRKIETQAKIARVQNAFPEMSMSDVIKLIAATDGQLSERTIWRYLGHTGN